MSEEISQLKKIIEGAVLASAKPISYEKLMSLFDEDARPKKAELVDAFKSLQEDYQGRGIELQEVASGLRFQVSSKVTTWVSRLYEEKPQRYSRALLETIAIIAYRQPVTRGGIEEVRGVAVSSNIIRTLQEREWVRVVGHLDVPGRPALYATTKQFLDYFNLKSLNELPSLSEIKDLEQLNHELDLEDDAREKLIEMIEQERQANESELLHNTEADSEQDLAESEQTLENKAEPDADNNTEQEIPSDINTDNDETSQTHH